MGKEDVTPVAGLLRASGDSENERGLERMLYKSSVACMVAEADGSVVGFMSYDVARVSKIKVVSFVVSEPQRRQKIGTAMIMHIVGKLNGRRNKVELSVSEYNLPAQLFLRSAGFKAESAKELPTGQSEYKFVYRLAEATQPV